jgi:peptide deformylase
VQGQDVSVEGCLSIPGVSGEVKRAAKVVVEAWDRSGQEIRISVDGWGARALLHEIDHLDGILFIDRAEKLVNGD